MYVCMNLCKYVCIRVCMYVCIYVCVCVCVCVCIYTYIVRPRTTQYQDMETLAVNVDMYPPPHMTCILLQDDAVPRHGNSIVASSQPSEEVCVCICVCVCVFVCA
jgi:hypothetical protein